MLTFTDLINSGIAPSPYKKNVVGNDNDRFVINYNNIWGVISDTHMSKGEDGVYYITGQLFKDKQKTSQFIYAWTWGGYCFKDSSQQCESLFKYCQTNYKTISHEIVNGDDVLAVRDFTEEQKEFYIKYYGCNSQDGCVISADYKKREEGEQKNAEIARSLNFVY